MRSTMQRASAIIAMINRSRSDFADLRVQYEKSLHHKHVEDDLKISIKSIFENLRSSLDYLAQDIFDIACAGQRKPRSLYFPIRDSASDFHACVLKDFPTLEAGNKAVYEVIEAVQPYRDPWLGQFNKLNNQNKHQNLVEQTRTEQRQVTVSRGDTSVSWGAGVTFGAGVSVMGVPIDPRTQMPVPNAVTKTEVTTWVDFRFGEIDQPVLTFIETSIARVKGLFQEVQKYL